MMISCYVWSHPSWEALASREPIPVSASIQKNAHQILIQVKWPGFYKQWVPEEQAYDIFTHGSGQNRAIGEPRLPFLSYFFAIPEDANPGVQIEYVSTVLLGNIPLIINRESGDDALFLKERAYPQESTLDKVCAQEGPVTVRLQRMGKWQGLDIIHVTIAPFQAIRDEMQITVGENFRIELLLDKGEWKNCPAPFPLSLPQSIVLCAGEDASVQEEEDPEEYLIVAPEEFVAALRPLQQWREQEGFLVTIKTIDQIKKEMQWTELLSADKLQQYLSLYFHKAANLTYVLLVGDVEIIPVQYKNDDGTDFQYSLLDGTGDLLPDVYLGRFPVNTADEVTAIIEKIKTYEKMTPSKKVLLASYFQDEGLDGVADRDYIQTCEKFRSYLLKRQYDVKCVYTKTNGSNPTYFSDLTPVPKSLTFEGTTQDVLNAINTGATLVCHRDHGEHTGWNHPSFRTTDLSQLWNERYPILFNVDCTTGQFDRETEKERRETEGAPLSTTDESFTEQILKLRNRGIVAAIAPTRETVNSLNDVFNRGLMQALWPKMFDASYSPATRLGQVLYRARIQVVQEHGDNGWVTEKILTNFRQYHILGDPALRLRLIQ